MGLKDVLRRLIHRSLGHLVVRAYTIDKRLRPIRADRYRCPCSEIWSDEQSEGHSVGRSIGRGVTRAEGEGVTYWDGTCISSEYSESIAGDVGGITFHDSDIDALVITDAVALVIDAVTADVRALRSLLTPSERRGLREALVAVVVGELGCGTGPDGGA